MTGLAVKSKGMPKTSAYSTLNEPFFVQLVGLAAQRATDDLLAQKLGAEGANAENVGDGVGIPAFGEHRDRDDAADGAAKLAGLADGVHDLAEQFLVGDVVAGTGVAGALHDLAAKALDLVGGHAAEVVVERVAGFELLAVDEQRVRARERVAGGFVEIAEQCEATVLQRGGAVLVLAMEAGDEVVNELRDGGVLADDDEAGRHLDALVLPELEGLLVVAVEGFQRRLQAGGELERVEFLAFAAALLGHVLADVLPEIAEHRHLVAGDVLRHRDARQLDDAALDGVHEREVAHRPREQRALGIAGAAQEEWRCGQVDDAAEAELAVHGFEAGNPEARGLVVLLGFLPLVALQVLVVGVFRLLPIAVVRLVVDDEDVLHAHQVGHHALDHLAFGFQRVQFLAGAALQELAAALGQFDALAQLEGVVVGDDDLGPVHVVEHVARDELAAGVVAVGVVRLEDAQPVLDRQAGCADEKAAREMLARRTAHGIDRLPRDEHGHHGGLAGAGGQLQREPHQFRIGVLVRRGEMVEQPLAVLSIAGATSVSQIAVSTASTWQKNGRTPLNL